MKRRSFFGTLLAALSLPVVVKAKSRDLMDFIKKYPRTEAESFRNPLEADGVLNASGEVLTIISPSCVARVGDIIATTVGPRLLITDVVGIYEQGDGYFYRCRDTEKPKTICDIPVIMINGKYMRYAKIDAVKLKFMPIISTFKESFV